jgi:hypothetical protein
MTTWAFSVADAISTKEQSKIFLFITKVFG